MERIYACIDLKSFYASAEAVERGLDPMKVNLVVADGEKGGTAITLAITPAMKERGVKNRCRLYEIPRNIQYIIAKPRMKLYMKYSAEIYGIYLSFFAPEDIHIYSVDECFIDLTEYIKLYKKDAKQIMKMVMEKVLKEKGIRSSVGIGTNLFLAKMALDITAKHSKDSIGYVDKDEFEKIIVRHRPIKDIWGIGRNMAKTLEKHGIYDLDGIRKTDPKLIYRLFGINAEIIIDHANGIEPCTIKEIHEYKPESRSIGNSQILPEDYNYEDAWIVAKEMIEKLTLELTAQGNKTELISLKVGYSRDTYKDTGASKTLTEPIQTYSKILKEFEKIYTKTTIKSGKIRKISITLGKLGIYEETQLNFFEEKKEKEKDEKEVKLQKTLLEIKEKFGKNMVLRGISYMEKATAKERNKKIGGHNGGEEDK